MKRHQGENTRKALKKRGLALKARRAKQLSLVSWLETAGDTPKRTVKMSWHCAVETFTEL